MSDGPKFENSGTLAALVRVDLWERAKAKDQEAIKALQQELDNVVLYDHIFVPEWPIKHEWVWVDPEALFEAGVIEAIRLHVRLPPD